MPSFFQSIAAIFIPGRDGSSLTGRDRAMSSTHDAFSLPTHSPTFAPHSFSAVQSPDGAESPIPSYTYPPAAHSPNVAYDYVPHTSGYSSGPFDTPRTLNPINTQASSSTGYSFSRSRPASLLPLHHAPLSPLPPYPPPAHSWERLRTWLASEYPELGDTLNYGILPADLTQVELQFGFSLPAAVRDSYLAVDGQEAESAAGCSEGIFFGLTLLPLEEVLEEWRFWREVDDDPQTGANPRLQEVMQSIPPGWVRREYSQRGWIPLVADKAGNYLGIDLNPDSGGVAGQVIVFGRDFDTKVVMWRGEGEGGWAKWLASFVEEIENGDGFEVGGNAETGSDDSEDEVGYESYFFDGSANGNKGQGGGDRGVTGLKMTGEYKGWNVLEAWADRSVRKWKEVGLVPDGIYPLPEPRRVLDTHATGMLPVEKSAEVPIPILADVDDTPPPVPAKPAAPRTIRPLPMPLSLPTRSDINPSPGDTTPTSSHGSLTPIERHKSERLPMREITPPTINIDPSALTPVPTESTSNELLLKHGAEPPEPVPSSSVAHDLLTDHSLPLDNSPSDLDPLGAASLGPVLAPVPASPSGSSIVSPDQPDNEVATPTVRLVGGGGTSGVVQSEEEDAMAGNDHKTQEKIIGTGGKRKETA